nr:MULTISPECIES: hypothetical protein [unclassified Bacillus (in: firmicutes)]
MDAPTECAALVKVDFKYLLPFLDLVDFLLPALSLCPGTIAAQEHNRGALPYWFSKSVPIPSATVCDAP